MNQIKLNNKQSYCAYIGYCALLLIILGCHNTHSIYMLCTDAQPLPGYVAGCTVYVTGWAVMQPVSM